MRRRRAGLPSAEVEQASGRVCVTLLGLSAIAGAPWLAAYVACAGEVDVAEVLTACLRRGQRLLLPRFEVVTGQYTLVPVADLERDTAPGHFGIREPAGRLTPAPTEVWAGQDVVWLVPGLAFDERGNRLGRGRGYYDRLLAGTAGCRIGVAYDWQVLPVLPHDGQDVSMHMVVTDRRVLERNPRSADAGQTQ